MSRRAALATAGAFLVLAAAGCGGVEKAAESQEGASAPAVDVAVESLAPVDWPETYEVTAGVKPFRRATPGTILMGRVEEVAHREGDRVEAGDLLARIESKDVEAHLAQAQAAVEAARAQEANARAMRERMERLYPKNAASKKNLDDAVAGHEAALAGLRAAEQGVAAAHAQLAYAEVRAPFDGVVTARNVEAGDMAAPGMPLFVVDDISKMKIEAAVPESIAGTLKPGDAAEVEVKAVSDEALAGTLAEVLPAADPMSRTFTARVILPNAGHRLKPGMFARIVFAGGSAETLAVPEGSIVRKGPLTGVYVVDAQQRARLRWITIGDAHDGLRKVLTGLKAGDHVVTEGADRLEDNVPVTVR